MVIRIREIKKNIAEKVKADPTLNAAGERLATRLSAIEEDLYQVRNHSYRDPLNYPIKLNNQLATLVRVIESADSRPTDQSYTVFEELSARLAEIKRRYGRDPEERPVGTGALDKDASQYRLRFITFPGGFPVGFLPKM